MNSETLSLEVTLHHIFSVSCITMLLAHSVLAIAKLRALSTLDPGALVLVETFADFTA